MCLLWHPVDVVGSFALAVIARPVLCGTVKTGVLAHVVSRPLQGPSQVVVKTGAHRYEKPVTSISQILMLPDDYGVPKDRCLCAVFQSVGEALGFSQRVQKFCLDQGIDSKRAFRAALCTEEMAVNVITHGFTKEDQVLGVRIFVERDQTLTLRFGDDDSAFDLLEFRKMTKEVADDPTANIGIKIVFAAAKEVKYFSSFGMNNTVIRM